MGRLATTRYYVADFETTVYPNQKFTEVWATGIVEMFTDDAWAVNSIDELFDYIFSLDHNSVWYFHNLKFDGSFIISYLMTVLKLKEAYDEDQKKFYKKFSDMPHKSFKYSISAMGQWYTITISYNKHKIEIRDSLKLLPYSVKAIGESFGTKHKKTEIDYEGFRYAGCEITDKEREYIINDVMVVKEALEIMFRDGHDKLTIGACCLREFKAGFDEKDYYYTFPDIYKIELNPERYTQETVGDYIHTSYRGGWCYVVKGKQGKIFLKGLTADVNSLYPSVMHSESGNYYPVGYPNMWYGNYIPKKAKEPERYYFIRIRTRFKIKEGYLPFIQIKRNKRYKSTDSLTTSDVLYNGKYYEEIEGKDGNKTDTFVTLTLTMTDFELIKKHYDLIDMTIISGCWFKARIGIFDDYINKYREIKINSKGAVREEAKLFLNNLYGKLASSKDSSYKRAYVKDDESVGYNVVHETDKKPGYIPCGSAVTSYARCFTITAAQENYYGEDKAGFIYADTDSIHCDLDISELKGVEIHETNFNRWSIECYWDEAIFTRQKTYIEHVIFKKGRYIDNPYYDIKCAGMPDKCKDYFDMSMQGVEVTEDIIKEKKLNEEKIEFIKTKRTISDFKRGLRVPGKLMPNRIKGGIILKDTTYQLR